jgi:tetratricopeptide (TPR) repeat protein
MSVHFPSQTFVGIWNWIPEKIVQGVPAFAKWRRQSAQKHAKLAVQSYEAANIDAAIAEFSKAIELEPRNCEYLYELGRIYYDQSNLVSAEGYFRRALNVDFSYAYALKGLAYTLHGLGRTDEAIYSLLRYLEESPNDRDVHAFLIAALEADGKYDEAIRAGELAMKIFRSDPGLAVALGRNYYYAGKNEAAVSQLRQAIELDPNDSEIHWLLGIVLQTDGDLEGALKSFQEAVGKNPENADAHLQMAQVYDQLNRDAEYLQAARTARRLFESGQNNDGVKGACWEEGWALYKLGRWAESAQASECALGIDDSLAPVRFNLGLALLRLGKPERAKDEYEKALDATDLSSLKTHGIDDLTAALKEDPGLGGAREILQQLENKYQYLTSQRQEELAAQGNPKRSQPR